MAYQTKLRASIRDILLQYHTPLSVQEIMQNLQKIGIIKNITSVYRQLESLEKSGFINKNVFSDGVARYESRKTDHIHFCCNVCGTITCLDFPEPDKVKLLNSLNNKTAIQSLNIEVTGVCEICG